MALYRLVPSLLALLICGSAHAVLVDKIAAVVNNEVILNSDIERFERTLGLRRELDPLFGFSEDLVSGKISRAKSLDFLIQERLITQTFKIPDTDVEQEIQSVQRNNNLSHDQLVAFLRTKGLEYPEYVEQMRAGLAKRNLLDREIRTRVSVSDDDVRAYFYSNLMRNSSVPMEYSLQLIVVGYRSYKTVQAAQDTAEDGLHAIKQGESFNTVAERLHDPTAGQGGELGYLSSELLAEPLKSAVKKLQINKVGDEVLKAPKGFMIVKLLDVRSSESQKLTDMKEQIREQLAKEEYKKQLFIWAERAQNNAYVHINN